MPDNLIYLNMSECISYGHKLHDINLPKNLCHLIINNDNMLGNITKNIIIGKYIKQTYIEYTIHNKKYHISQNTNEELIKYIDNQLKNVLIGHIILKELVIKILEPTRLKNICKQYNISFIELLRIYF